MEPHGRRCRHPTAQVKIGFAYLYGPGHRAKTSPRRASVFAKAAEKGDAAAQFNIGTMHENGQGVPVNLAEANKWYRLSADQGLTPAQVKIGPHVLLRTGTGFHRSAALVSKGGRQRGCDRGTASRNALRSGGRAFPKTRGRHLIGIRKRRSKAIRRRKRTLGSFTSKDVASRPTPSKRPVGSAKLPIKVDSLSQFQSRFPLRSRPWCKTGFHHCRRLVPQSRCPRAIPGRN